MQRFKGVSWNKGNSKWEAYIGFNNKKFILGYFDDQEEALKARKEAEGVVNNPQLRINKDTIINRLNDIIEKNRKETLGVTWDRKINKYIPYIYYNKKKFYLGSFETKEEAIEVKKQAEKIANNPQPNINQDDILYSLKDIKKRNRKEFLGVTWNKKSNKWFAYIGFNKKKFGLGYFMHKEKAIKARKQAEEIINNPNLDHDTIIDRLNNIKEQNRIEALGVMWHKRIKKWIAYIGYNYKTFTLGYFMDKEEALKVRKQAEDIINNPDFDHDTIINKLNDFIWSNRAGRKFYIIKHNRKNVLGVAWSKNHNKWESYIGYNKKKFLLGRFKNKEEALKVRKRAEEIVNNSNFDHDTMMSMLDDIINERLYLIKNKKQEEEVVNNHPHHLNKDDVLYRLNNISNKKEMLGVIWNKKSNKWIAYIYYNKEQFRFGSFETKAEALKVRKQAEEIVNNTNLDHDTVIDRLNDVKEQNKEKRSKKKS